MAAASEDVQLEDDFSSFKSEPPQLFRMTVNQRGETITDKTKISEIYKIKLKL